MTQVAKHVQQKKGTPPKVPPSLLIEKADSDERLRELIVYISHKCEDDPSFGATKLNKILFYADFESYRSRGKAISGAEYFRLEHGPAPKRLKPILADLVKKRDVAVIAREKYGKTQNTPVPLREPNINDLFTAEDISIIDYVISLCKNLNASQLSEATHRRVAWRIMGDQESIPYALVHVSDDQPTTDDVERTKELARQHGWC